MGLLGSSFSSVTKRIFDRFNRVNQTGLGFTEDNTQWDIIRPGFNIVNQKAEATNANYPMAVVPFSGDVVISLSGISQGSSAALWVSDADNWWAVGIDQEPISCNCQTGSTCVSYAGGNCNPTDFPISCTTWKSAWNVAAAYKFNTSWATSWARNASTCQSSTWNAGTCLQFAGGGCGGFSGGNCSRTNSANCLIFQGGTAATYNSNFCRTTNSTSCQISTGGNCSSWNSTSCVIWFGGSCAANNTANCRSFAGGNCASFSCTSSSCSSWRCNRFFRGSCSSSSCASNRCNSFRCNSFNATTCTAFNSTFCSRWNSLTCGGFSGGNCRTFNSTQCLQFTGGNCSSWNSRNVATWNSFSCAQFISGNCAAWNSTFCVSYTQPTCVARSGNTSTCNQWALGTSYATAWSRATSYVSAWSSQSADTNAAISSQNCAVIREAYSVCCTAQSSFDDCQGQISSWNSTFCSRWENFQFGCQTCYPQYIRILQSAGSVVSEVFSWTVNSIINSLRIKTKGDQLTISAYSDENLTTQIGSDIVFTPTGITVHPSYGITIQPSGQNQGFSFDTFEITRN